MNRTKLTAGLLRTALTALLACAASACGDSNSATTPIGGGPGAAIAVLTRVCGPDNCQHYLNAFGALPEDGKIDRSTGIESGNTQGKIFNNAIYIFDRDDNAVTRWTVDAGLTLKKGATVSFRDAGVTDACAICNVFGTPEHAYMVDSAAGVMVSWNPTTMEIIAVLTMGDDILKRDGLPAGFAWPFVVDGRAFLAASWVNYDTYKAFGKAGVATFDATVDRPQVTVIEDDRCGVSSSVTPFADGDGNVYVVGDWFSGMLQIGATEPAPNPACLLRIKAGETRFDPDYYVNLLEVTDARALYGAYTMGAGKLLVNLWPSSEPPPTAEAIKADPFAYYSGTGFVYAVVDLDASTASRITTLAPAGAGNNTPLVMDGVNYIQVYPKGGTSDDRPGAGLYAVHPDGSTKKVLDAGKNADFEMIGRLR